MYSKSIDKVNIQELSSWMTYLSTSWWAHPCRQLVWWNRGRHIVQYRGSIVALSFIFVSSKGRSDGFISNAIEGQLHNWNLLVGIQEQGRRLLAVIVVVLLFISIVTRLWRWRNFTHFLFCMPCNVKCVGLSRMNGGEMCFADSEQNGNKVHTVGWRFVGSRHSSELALQWKNKIEHGVKEKAWSIRENTECLKSVARKSHKKIAVINEVFQDGV